MAKRDRVIYIDRGGLPVYIGFCPSKKAWADEVKRIGLKPGDSGYDCKPFGGLTQGFESSKTSKEMVMVFVGEDAMRGKEFRVVGILAHEAWHVWGRTLKYIGEKVQPPIGDEIGAYNVQRIVQELYIAYLQTRPRSKPKKPAKKQKAGPRRKAVR